MKMIIIWIIQYLSFKFISFRFYIWKIAKTKSLNHVSKNPTLIVNMTKFQKNQWLYDKAPTGHSKNAW
jgi:hypothetical protein